MRASDNQAQLETPADQAQIIFLRPPRSGGKIAASVFDLTNDDPEFLGIVFHSNRSSTDYPFCAASIEHIPEIDLCGAATTGNC